MADSNTAQNLSTTTKKIIALDKKILHLRRKIPDDSPPTFQEMMEVRISRKTAIITEINGLTARVLALRGSFKRGQNYEMEYNFEKQQVRKKIEVAKKRISF